MSTRLRTVIATAALGVIVLGCSSAGGSTAPSAAASGIDDA